jgi:hypothetical protein
LVHGFGVDVVSVDFYLVHGEIAPLSVGAEDSELQKTNYFVDGSEILLTCSVFGVSFN